MAAPRHDPDPRLRPHEQSRRPTLDVAATLSNLPYYASSLLFVDDGSTDETLALLEQAAATDPRIGVIELSRNFGKEMALTAGLHALDGDDAIVIAADL